MYTYTYTNATHRHRSLVLKMNEAVQLNAMTRHAFCAFSSAVPSVSVSSVSTAGHQDPSMERITSSQPASRRSIANRRCSSTTDRQHVVWDWIPALSFALWLFQELRPRFRPGFALHSLGKPAEHLRNGSYCDQSASLKHSRTQYFPVLCS